MRAAIVARVALIVCFVITALPFAAMAQVDEEPVMRAGGPVEGMLDFESCVRLALHQSPYFINSGMQIEMRRLEEDDAMYDMLPDIHITSSYVVHDPATNRDNPVRMGFSMNNYDPFTAYFEVQARELMTRLAVLGHLNALSDGIYEVAKVYLKLNTLSRTAAFQDELIALAEHKGEYVHNRIDSGGATPLDARIVEQEIELARLEREQIRISQSALLDSIKSLLGVPVEQNLELDIQDADMQVMGGFDPYAMELAEVRANSIELKVSEYTQELQEYNVQMAYARYIPSFTAGVSSADAMEGGADWYVSVGASTPLWDWGERARNVTREKNRLATLLAEEEMVTLDLDSSWRAALSDMNSASTSLQLARARAELAGLKRRQGEISYHAGTITFPEYLETIEAYFEAQKDVLNNELDYSLAMLNLRHLSGHLYTSFVDARLY